jgi:cohesin loading factor subunit SCC2
LESRTEDDGVRDLLHETFGMLWFAGRINSSRKGKHANNINCKKNQRTYATAKQMLEIVVVSPNSQNNLIALVKEILYGSNDNEKDKTDSNVKQKDTMNQCSDIVSYLFEELLRFEEKRSPNDKVVAGRQLVALFSTISVFSESSPTLLLPHIDTLLPYLKADNSVGRGSEAAIVYSLCKILSQMCTHCSEGAIQKLGFGDLPKDLMKVTYAFDSNPTSAAIELLSKCAKKLGTNDNPFLNILMKIAKIFYKVLISLKDKVADVSKLNGQQKSNIKRAMSVIGSICRYHYSESQDTLEDFDEMLFAIDPSGLTFSNLPYSSYAILEEYLEKDDISTKCHALRAMTGIFSSNPRMLFALEDQGALSLLMSDKSPSELQLETIKCFQIILCSEECRVESGEAKRQMQEKESNTSSKQVSGDQDGDATLIGSCCAEQLPRLFQMMSSCNPEIRKCATMLIETLSRQGLLNPLEAVSLKVHTIRITNHLFYFHAPQSYDPLHQIPHLIALQGDVKQPQIRSLSLKVLNTLLENRASMVRQGFSEVSKRNALLSQLFIRAILNHNIYKSLGC